MKLRELVEDVNAWARMNGQEPSVLVEAGTIREMELMEGLPTSYGKDDNERPKVDDIHARVIAALNGEPQPYWVKPLPKAVDLEEARKKAKEPVELPDGIHLRLFR